jgi:hypothetical protein
MKKVMTVLALLIVAQSLGGCVLLAAGVIGAEVEKNHQQWCYFHPGRC